MTTTAPARAALAAIAFLTRLPVGRLAALGPMDIARGAPLFPLVGAAVGGAAGLLADALVPGVPGLVAGGLAVGLAALVTGAMHLDALADTVDGLGAATREHALEIMRDHAVGAFGAVALSVVCLVDAAALGALAAGGDALLAGAIAGALGRGAMLPLARALPYARAVPGQGSVLEALRWPGVVGGVALAAVPAVAAGREGLAALVAAIVVACVLGLFFRSWLGGVTGDTLGATAKLCETAALVAFLAAL
jgi:cobalamin 5'-phosphate synthase/cobalamin synthase